MKSSDLGVHEWQKVEGVLVGLLTWVEENGYGTVGSVRQVYLEMPQVYAEGVPCVIELQVPVRLSGHQKT